jgi:serine/threonine protein phosphatase PrpC
VDPEEMAEVLSAAGSSQQACDRLLELALDYGGSDNITAIVASYSVA